MTKTSPTRQYPRLGAEKLVIIDQVGEEPRKERSRTRSMGPGGLNFELDEELALGAPLGLHVALGDEVLKVDGRVAYCRALDKGRFEIGVDYTELEPKELS